MKDRIKQYMDYKSISAGELSSLIDVQRSNISHILNGRNKPGASFIEKLLINFPDLNARWLFTGEGDMIAGEETTAKDNNKNSQIDLFSSTAETKQQPDTSIRATKDIDNDNKPVERVILLFKDGTFTDFNRK